MTKKKATKKVVKKQKGGIVPGPVSPDNAPSLIDQMSKEERKAFDKAMKLRQQRADASSKLEKDFDDLCKKHKISALMVFDNEKLSYNGRLFSKTKDIVKSGLIHLANLHNKVK